MQTLGVLNELQPFLTTVMLTIGALLPIVDPLGGAPIYLAMTASLAPAQRVAMAKAVARNSFILLIASVLFGAYVLAFFGLSIPAVQIAGGIVVCAIAWSLLHSPNAHPAVAGNAPQTVIRDDFSQRAFYPLTMPLTVGPGSISVALTLGVKPTHGFPSVVTALGHVLGILIVAVSVYLCYRYADRILAKLGPTGTGVVVRLSAFILLCIGVQICWNGVHALIVGAFPNAVSG